MDISSLKARLDAAQYVCDDGLATTLLVALKLGRPLLIEGAAGVGKTEIAKVMAGALDRDLVRLQCYEGLDESKALYEWNYQKQLLSIQVHMNRQDPDALTKSLFSDEYLLQRPLLQSIRSEKPVVLLIDEIDKADEEFEAFLLELLSEMQVTIPEVGPVRARSIPFVALTSNRTRPLSEALRRRCAYLYIPYPSVEKEVAIIRAKLPNVNEHLAVQAAQALTNLSNLLAAAGSGMDKVLKTTVFIKEMNDFGAINEVYQTFFSGDYPARSCVEVARLPKDVLIEIEAVAEKAV